MSNPPPDGALHFPATARNREPILAILRERLAPPVASVLEIAAGSGEHALYFAASLPHLRWQPTDGDPAHVASAEAWRLAQGTPNLLPARRLDVSDADWGPPVDAVYVANMFHISPFQASVAFFVGAARVLAAGALALTYGPYKVDGAHTAPSNEAFDASLRSRDPSWGLRDLAELASVAPDFELEARIPMPANNFSLIWRRR
jgi:hypothetical protein